MKALSFMKLSKKLTSRKLFERENVICLYPDHNSCPHWNPLNNTTLPIAQTSRHLELRPKSFWDVPWWPSVGPLRNVLRTPKTLVLSIQTCNNPHHVYCRKNCFFWCCFPLKWRRLLCWATSWSWWFLFNRILLKIMVLKPAMKPAQVSYKQLAGGCVASVKFLYL